MLKTLKIIGILVIVLIGILIRNTLTLNSKQVASAPLETITFPDDIFENLSEAIQYPTISYSEESIPDSTAFHGFHRFLSETFPLVHSRLVLEKINKYSLLFTWKGSDSSKKPVILMSHQDVVPVDQPTLSDWEAMPFEGKISSEHIIGRGTLDDKST